MGLGVTQKQQPRKFFDHYVACWVTAAVTEGGPCTRFHLLQEKVNLIFWVLNSYARVVGDLRILCAHAADHSLACTCLHARQQDQRIIMWFNVIVLFDNYSREHTNTHLPPSYLLLLYTPVRSKRKQTRAACARDTEHRGRSSRDSWTKPIFYRWCYHTWKRATCTSTAFDKLEVV